MDNMELLDFKDKNYEHLFNYSVQYNEYMLKKLDQLCRKDSSVIEEIDKKLKILKEYKYALLDSYDGESEKYQNIMNQIYLSIRNYTNIRLYYQMRMHLSNWTLWKIYTGYQG